MSLRGVLTTKQSQCYLDCRAPFHSARNDMCVKERELLPLNEKIHLHHDFMIL